MAIPKFLFFHQRLPLSNTVLAAITGHATVCQALVGHPRADRNKLWQRWHGGRDKEGAKTLFFLTVKAGCDKAPELENNKWLWAF